MNSDIVPLRYKLRFGRKQAEIQTLGMTKEEKNLRNQSNLGTYLKTNRGYFNSNQQR